MRFNTDSCVGTSEIHGHNRGAVKIRGAGRGIEEDGRLRGGLSVGGSLPLQRVVAHTASTVVFW